MQIGNGSHIYEIVEGWAKLPKGIELGYTHGVVVDSIDQVYVFNMSKDAVMILDREGNYIDSWGEQFADGAHGMYLHKEDDGEYLYLTDYEKHIVVKTTLDGKTIFTLGVPDNPIYDRGFKYNPTDTAVAPNGDFYTCDGYGMNMVHKYDKFGRLIKSWGGKGTEPGKMDSPHGIWIDTRGSTPLVYVADRENNRIQIFTTDGEHVRFVTNDIDYPCCFYESENEIYIPDLHSRITILDKNDELITHLGEDQTAWKKEGWPRRPMSEHKIGSFISPHGLCVDSHRDIYVAEWVPSGRLTKLIRV